MPNTIHIPTPLRPFTDKKESVEVSGATVGELLKDLTTRHDGLKKHLYTDEGRLRNFVNVYLNDEDIRYLQKEQTPVKPGDSLSIVPSVAGGLCEHRNRDGAPDAQRRGDQALQPPPDHAGGRHGRAAQDQGGQRAVHRRGRARARRRRCIWPPPGVGRIGIVDFDVVDYSNLQRQLLHTTNDVGRTKLESAKEQDQRAQPARAGETYEEALSSDNAMRLFKGYDVILDGTDNFPTRYLVNDACVLMGIPTPTAASSASRAGVGVRHQGRPVLPLPLSRAAASGLVPSCAEGGVLGVLPGVIGVIQATESIKLLTGIGQPLIGRFLIYDALNMKFRELKLRKDPDCPVCGTHPTVPSSSTTTSSAASSSRRRTTRRSHRERNRNHPGRAEEEARRRRDARSSSTCASPTSTRSTRSRARRSSRSASCRAATRNCRRTARSSPSARWAAAAPRRRTS
jgi:adenylyltransferase/sulfurtransferase